MNSKLKDHLLFLLIIISLLFIKRSDVLKKFAVVIKEDQILRRTINQNQIKFYTDDFDRLLLHETLKGNKKLHKFLTLFSPETVLKKWKNIIKKRNTYPGKRKPGRSPR